MQTIEFLQSNISKMTFVNCDSSDVETFRYQDQTGFYEIEIYFGQITNLLYSKFGFEAMQEIKF